MTESGIDLDFDLFDLSNSIFTSNALDFLDLEGKSPHDSGFYEMKSKSLFDSGET